MATGKRIGPDTGKPEAFASWEEFNAAFETQLKALIDRMLAISDEADRIRAEFEPTPYLSTLVGGCAEKGRDVTQGGARHGYITVEGVAFATAADSLAAVKKLVYEDGKVTMTDLVRALHEDFEGYEPLRQTLINKAPKYGNDDDYADEVARDLSQTWTRAGHRAHLSRHRQALPRRLSLLELLDRLRALHRGYPGRQEEGHLPLQRHRAGGRRGPPRPHGRDTLGGQDGAGDGAQRGLPHHELQPVPAA